MIFSDIFAFFLVQNFKTKVLTAQKFLLLECLCIWGAWGAWSSCSQPCGGGSQRRTRNSSGSGCNEAREEVIPCNQGDCTNGWVRWGAWGACTASCGQGVQRRRRWCRQEGRCQGENAETKGCRGEECGCRTGNSRVRKNVSELTSRERRSLVAAMEAAISRGEYVRVANFHGFPGNICNTTSVPESCCPHGTTNFLPWYQSCKKAIFLHNQG